MDEHYVFSKAALKRVDGKTVPLTMTTGGEKLIVGTATLRVDDTGLSADIITDDELLAAFFRENPLS